MKLYTEEQVREAMFGLHPYADLIDWTIKNLTPIELPSDEEIEESSLKMSGDNISSSSNFMVGAYWMIDKILKNK